MHLGLSLMASVQIAYLLFFLLPLAVRPQVKTFNFISLGSSLSPNGQNSSWLSPSLLFAFGFYPQGNGFAIGIWLASDSDSKSENTVVWTANRDDPSVPSNSSLDFTRDGKLLLQTEQGKEKPIVDLPEPAVSASMLDSGNFVIYNNNSQIIWQSFDFPTDTLLGDQILPRGHMLVSSRSTSDHMSGQFFLAMGNDGNLSAYPGNLIVDVYWDTQTAQTSDGYPVQLYLNSTGILYLGHPGVNVKILANSSYLVKNKTVIYRATLDAGGIFRLYSHHFTMRGTSNMTLEWSALQNQCEVKGFCGFNSFCSSTSTRADCFCFPGFVFINPDMKFQGCYTSFNGEGCKRKEPALLYNITSLDNVKLRGDSYAMLSMNKENCSKSCLEDCNCRAAFYLNGTCYKFKLPLMYGMVDQNGSAMVFMKMSLGISGAADHKPPIPGKPLVVTESKKKLILLLAISLGSITFLCSLIAISSFFLYRHQANRYEKLSENVNLGLRQEFTLQSFSYSELEKATDGFKEQLGTGCFGAVYRGAINGGKKIVAVKRLEKVVGEGERNFRAEITAIGRTHHKNLVHLLGYCFESSRKLLVYEYMSNGSLADILFNVERRPPWKERLRIALDIARGILYLHEECETQIIHCDIKPQNILMDDFWTAKISDFGLAKLLMPNQTGTITGVRGTIGYLAPEWQKNALITVKSDVYSFGIVLLEIVYCRSNIEVNVSSADEVLLSTWVYNCFMAGELHKLIADEKVDMKTLERMVKVGLLCIQENPCLRPSMKDVILMLEGTMDIRFPPFPTPL